jgi:hypothetical protein
VISISMCVCVETFTFLLEIRILLGVKYELSYNYSHGVYEFFQIE